MASNSGAVYGLITLDGLEYIERHQVFGAEVTITQPGQLITNLRLTLPGVANFLLKGLTRDIVNSGDPFLTAEAAEYWRFRLINSEGTTWFHTGGLGITDDRVISNLCFGSGQFPFPLIPPIPVHSNGTLLYEVQDMGFYPTADPSVFPYTICFGFQGSYLFPPEDVLSQGPLAFPGVTHGIVLNK